MKNADAVQVFAILVTVVQPSLGMPSWSNSILSPALECVDSGAATFDNFMNTFIPPSTAPINGTTYTERFRDSLLQTIEEEVDERVVEAESTRRVTAPPNITVSAPPQEQHVEGHERSDAASEPDGTSIAHTNIELYLPAVGRMGVGSGARGMVQWDQFNRTTSQRVTWPLLAFDYDVGDETSSNTIHNDDDDSRSSGGGGGDDDDGHSTGNAIFCSIAGMLSDMGQFLVNVFGLDSNNHGTLLKNVSGRIAK
eukprot:g11351.t1